MPPHTLKLPDHSRQAESRGHRHLPRSPRVAQGFSTRDGVLFAIGCLIAWLTIRKPPAEEKDVILKEVKVHNLLEDIYWESQRAALASTGTNLEFQFPDSPDGVYMHTNVTMWHIYRPYYNCMSMEHVGDYDANAKWVCGLHTFLKDKEPCIAYIFTEHDQSEAAFMRQLAARSTCTVFSFSPPDKGPQGPGIEGVTRGEGVVADLKALLEANAHEWVDVMLLDMREQEWEAIPPLLYSFERLPVGQLIITLYPREGLTKGNQVLKFMRSLHNRDLRIFASQPRLSAHSPAHSRYPITLSMVQVDGDGMVVTGTSRHERARW